MGTRGYELQNQILNVTLNITQEFLNGMNDSDINITDINDVSMDDIEKIISNMNRLGICATALRVFSGSVMYIDLEVSYQLAIILSNYSSQIEKNNNNSNKKKIAFSLECDAWRSCYLMNVYVKINSNDENIFLNNPDYDENILIDVGNAFEFSIYCRSTESCDNVNYHYNYNNNNNNNNIYNASLSTLFSNNFYFLCTGSKAVLVQIFSMVVIYYYVQVTLAAITTCILLDLNIYFYLEKNHWVGPHIQITVAILQPFIPIIMI